MKRRAWPLIVGLGYIALIWKLGGLRGDHVLFGLLPLLDYYNERTRLWLKFFFPMIMVGVVYDSMRYYYWWGIWNRTHVAGPYYRDLSWFGINLADGKRVTPNEFFQIHHWPVVDFFTGLAYLTFVFEYLGLGFYLFFKNKLRLLWIFACCFFTVNVMGYITYYIYAAAPPWYVTKYGLGPGIMNVRPESGSAYRFDEIFHTHFFDQMYGRGIDVYGAYPSLHVSYPFMVAWITFAVKDLKWARIPAVFFYFLMCFSAVYLQHHYVVDILLGTAYALFVILVAKLIMHRQKSGAAVNDL